MKSTLAHKNLMNARVCVCVGARLWLFTVRVDFSSIPVLEKDSCSLIWKPVAALLKRIPAGLWRCCGIGEGDSTRFSVARMSLVAQKQNNTCLLISGRDGDIFRMQQNHEIRTRIYTSDLSFIVTSISLTQSMIKLYLANNIRVDRSYRGYIPFRKWRNKTHTQCVY